MSVSVSSNWVPDEVASGCFDCGDIFGTFRRRHHCRICGGVFCSRCCAFCITINGSCQRACRNCERKVKDQPFLRKESDSCPPTISRDKTSEEGTLLGRAPQQESILMHADHSDEESEGDSSPDSVCLSPPPKPHTTSSPHTATSPPPCLCQSKRSVHSPSQVLDTTIHATYVPSPSHVCPCSLPKSVPYRRIGDVHEHTVECSDASVEDFKEEELERFISAAKAIASQRAKFTVRERHRLAREKYGKLRASSISHQQIADMIDCLDDLLFV